MNKNANETATGKPARIEIINDWAPEVSSLLRSLKASAFLILSGNNGEEAFTFPDPAGVMKIQTVEIVDAGTKACKTQAEFIEELIATDEARLWVYDPAAEKSRWLYLVLGNSPGELVSDYSVPRSLDGKEDRLGAVTSSHYEKWQLRGQPKKRGYYSNGKFIKA